MSVTKLSGVLEIDHERGVIYFHLDKVSDVAQLNVQTVLRIGGLPRPIPSINGRLLDLTIRPQGAREWDQERQRNTTSDWQVFVDWNGV